MIIILKVIISEWWVKHTDPHIRLYYSTLTKQENGNKLFVPVWGGNQVW